MALGMFCAVPLPFQVWDEKCMNLMLPCFPLIGGMIGALWWGFAELLIFSGIHLVLVSAVLAVFPFFITGFLHLDGYMDTSDAVLSRRPLEDKLRILKDPHTGAFAVIMTAVLFVLQFAAVYAIAERGKYLISFIIIAVISRCGGAVSILCLTPAPQSGYANMFRRNSKTAHKIFIIFTVVFIIIFSYFCTGIYGIIVAVSVILGYIGAMTCAYGNLKGVSGDLAGFALVVSELCGLFALAVTGG